MEGHEPPSIDRGSDAALEPGHVDTIEPGSYMEEAGYRHSDTVAVTDDGIESLTDFRGTWNRTSSPGELASNVVPA